MKGKIGYARHVKRYYVSWYHAPDQKTYKIYQYRGFQLSSRALAKKLLVSMQGDVEKGVFRVEAYTRAGCAVIPYLRQWLESVKGTISPATHKDYKNSIDNHLVPFFETKNIELHDIQYDTLMELLAHIERDGKGKLNVMYCLHACLDHAWRSNRIPMVPPFPKKKNYNITETPLQWLPEERQRSVIQAIAIEDQPVFWWLKFHLRRPCEAMALHKTDFDGMIFIIHRSFSAKQLIDRTKTGEVHYVPMVDEFIPYLEVEKAKRQSCSLVSPYFFIHPRGKQVGQHYTHKVLSDLWNRACKKVGESIPLYPGVKHSSCSQLVNEYGYSIHDVQMATGSRKARIG